MRFVNATAAHPCTLDRADLLVRIHARGNGGPKLAGAAASAAMWRAISLLRPLGLLAGSYPVLSSMERVYLHFVRVQPRLQRWLVRSEAWT